VRTDVTPSNPVVAPFTAGLPNARLYLPGLPTSTKIDSDVYVPLIGKITRGEPVEPATQAAAEAINKITGCKS
jgi:multiple sugar transport system substrate-binding protein